MTSSLYICIGWFTFCVDRLSAEISVSYPVGSTVMLPCKLQTADTKPHIEWSIYTKTVFERHDEEFIQGEGYEGRVDVPEDELRKGICSLVLNNLTLTDAGVYTSRLLKSRTKRSASESISSVKLSVYGKPVEKSSPETSLPAGAAGMKCPHPLITVSFLMFTLLAL